MTKDERELLKVWPMSNFEKVDVLGQSLNQDMNNNIDLLEKLRVSEMEKKNSMVLPVEIIVKIMAVLQAQGKLKPKFLRVSKLFYLIVRRMIYYRPKLKATNFFSFVNTISTSKTIGENIVELDLSYIIQTGKNAFVAKLLKRSRKNLKLFVAPQTSFGLGPLIALKNCEKLQILDLGLVSETLNLPELFNSIKNLNNLTHLSFPRSSVEVSSSVSINWPPKLTFLRLSGGITDQFLLDSDFPPSITQLEFSHCPAVHDFGFNGVLLKIGRNLKSLRVQYPMPGFKDNAMNWVFTYCPNLTSLEIAVDYVTSSFFDEDVLVSVPYDRPLKTLYINSSGMLGTSTKLNPIDLAVAINDNRLPCLKNIQCTAKLGWDPNSDYVSFIADYLDEKGGGLYIGY